MADLMSGVYTYDSLADTYENFHIPAIRLYVNGSEVSQDISRQVVYADVQLSLQAASVAVLKLGGFYDREKRAFDSSVKSKFKLGTIVEVALGYGSQVKKILKGFVALLGAEFNEAPCLVVTVMDVRRLMMVSGVRHVLHDVQNYSDAVKTILGDYSKLCSAEIDATSDKLESPLSQNATDYDFIVRELCASGRTGREFFVLADKAYFRKPKKSTSAIMKLEYGRELRSFQMESAYTNLSIEVSGYNQRDQQTITAKATAKSTESQSSLTSSVPTSCISDPEADTKEKAQVRADALAAAAIAEGQKASGVCIGLPELVPGRFVEVVKLEEMANKKYYITSVKHTFSGDIFETEFETEGWS